MEFRTGKKTLNGLTGIMTGEVQYIAVVQRTEKHFVVTVGII